jgi:hypothetical protein
MRDLMSLGVDKDSHLGFLSQGTGRSAQLRSGRDHKTKQGRSLYEARASTLLALPCPYSDQCLSNSLVYVLLHKAAHMNAGENKVEPLQACMVCLYSAHTHPHATDTVASSITSTRSGSPGGALCVPPVVMI